MADIFISYTSADSEWAEWIAQQLEKLGHVPHVHDWEISGGGNIMAWMEERHQNADHILCVISNAYMAASYSSWERQAAQWAAASKRPNFALPMFVEDCEASTLLAITKRCDLYGVSEEDARTRLANFMTPAAKPAMPVSFPGIAAPPLAAKPTVAVPRQMVEFPGRAQALSNIPIAVPRHFVGRDEVLGDIRTALTRGDGRVAITALHGLRGVGKTTLAAAYADKHRADYRATWWIRAQTDSNTRADLVALGVRLGWVAADEKEEAALLTVKEKLRHEGDGILLIFDNANNQDELRPYMPATGATHLLVTSNAPNWAGVAAPVQIKVWPKETGAEFFLSRVPGRASESVAAEKLSEALGGLPLAHEQAAAFCERLGLSFEEYLKRFAATPAKLLDAEKDAPTEYHDRTTVAKTFALAIDEAAKLHPAAEPLIVHAALLAPEPIPLFLFSEGRDKFAEPFASILADDGLDEAVAALRAFALIERESIPDERDSTITTDCIRLHRLVREVATARSTGALREDAFRSLIRASDSVYPAGEYTAPSKWPRARRLDALALALVTNDISPPVGAEMPAARLLNELAVFRRHVLAAYSDARPLYERALRICETVGGPEHPDTAACLSNLGLLLVTLLDFASARPLLERAVAIRQKVSGPDDLTTATSLNNLAGMFREQGEPAQARPLFERALAIREKIYGSDHPDIALSLNNLGLVLADQGEFVAAKRVWERALAIREKILGPEHPDTAFSLINLAALIRLEDNAIKALPMFRRALAIREKFLGPEHPSTRSAASHTAAALDDLGRAKEAKALREKYGVETPPRNARDKKNKKE
jgi:tetratricopeptide (TPR) repeat protein